jgi:hypothetical protein
MISNQANSTNSSNQPHRPMTHDHTVTNFFKCDGHGPAGSGQIKLQLLRCADDPSMQGITLGAFVSAINLPHFSRPPIPLSVQVSLGRIQGTDSLRKADVVAIWGCHNFLIFAPMLSYSMSAKADSR